MTLAALAGLVGCRDPAPGGAAPPAAKSPDAAAARGPVLLELFTSQGCSSCPPADRLLSAAGRGAFGSDVIPLAFHVDYWNRLGWADPFSSAAFSARQRRYGRALSDGRVYTPMAVIDGRVHLVGSDRAGLARAIDAERRRPDPWALSLSPIERRGEAVRARLSIRRPEGGDAEVFVALVQSGLRTAVPRGENAGRQLASDFIVRRLVKVSSAAGEQAVEVPIDPTWRGGALGLVAFAQRPGDMAVLGAAAR